MKKVDGAYAKEVYQELTTKLYGQPIALIENTHLKQHVYSPNQSSFLSIFQSKIQLQTYSIGNFQAIEDVSVAQNLLKFSVELISSWGGNKIYGPMHGNTFFPYRFTKSENMSLPLFASEMPHLVYYPAMWESYGFEISHTYNTYLTEIKETAIPEPIGFERIDLSLITKEQLLKDLYEFSHQSFSKNILYEPISFKTFQLIYTPYLAALNSKLCQVIYDEERIVGLFFAFPDKNRKNTVVVKTLARLLEPKYKGLGNQMSFQFVYDAYQQGFRHQIHAYFHQDNKSKKVSENFGGRSYKTHNLYSLDLNIFSKK